MFHVVSFAGYLYVSGSESFPRLGKRELIYLLLFTCNHVVSVGPLGAWDGLRYFIVALP